MWEERETGLSLYRFFSMTSFGIKIEALKGLGQ